MKKKLKRGVAFTISFLLATKSLPLQRGLPQIRVGGPNKKDEKSCNCTQSTLKLFTFPLGLISPHQFSLLVGGEAQKIKVDAPDSISSVCGAAEGTFFCGPREITFFDLVTNNQVTEWPHKGVSWEEKNQTLIIKPISDFDIGAHSLSMKVALKNFPQVSQTIEFRYDVVRPFDPNTDHAKNRKLQSNPAVIPDSSPQTTENYCLNPDKKLNLLTTTVKASQSSFDPDISTTPNNACDGITNIQTDQTKVFITSAQASSPPFLKLEFLTSTLVQTVLILQSLTEPYLSNLSGYQLLCGDSADINTSQPCAEQLTTTSSAGVTTTSVGGWSTCGLTGKYFWVKGVVNQRVFFPEIMLFSQESISKNMAWSSSISLDSTFFSYNSRSISVVVDAASQTKYCTKTNDFTTSIEYSGVLPTKILIDGITIIGSSDPAWQNAQKNIQVYVKDGSSSSTLCGTIADYNQYQEIWCNVVGNQIILKIQAPNTFLGFCSLGILVSQASCSCSQTLLDPAQFTPKQTPLLSASTITAGQSVVHSNQPDTISKTCGDGSGFSKCPHTTKFYSVVDNQEITSWPYKSLSYSQRASDKKGVFSILNVDPADAGTTFVIKVAEWITENSLIQTSQFLTVNMVQNFCTIPNTGFSLFNTDAKPAMHSTISYPHPNSPIPGCDGIIIQESLLNVVHTNAHDATGITQFFRVELPIETQIQTVMFEARTEDYYNRIPSYIITVGNNQDVTQNDQCVPLLRMTTSGWYPCSTIRNGKFVGFYPYPPATLKSISFLEVNAFSFQAIQYQAKTASFYGNDQLGFGALKAITERIVPDFPDHSIASPAKNYLGYQDTCCMTNLVSDPQFSMEWGTDKYLIKSVILFPSQRTENLQYETDVKVFVQDGEGPENYCGMISAYNVYFELKCEILGNRIILKKSGTNVKLVFCSVGVIAQIQCVDCVANSASPTCQCTTTTFDTLKSFFSTAALTMKTSDPQTKVTLNSQTQDTVSKNCGLKDGYSFCGPRTFNFYDRTAGLTIQVWPYKGWTFDKVSSKLTVIPSPFCLGTNEIDVSIGLDNFPQIPQLTYKLTITVLDDPKLPDPCNLSSIKFLVLAETSYSVTLTQYLDSPIKLKAPAITDSYSKQLGVENSCGPYQFKAFFEEDAAKLVTLNSVTGELTFRTNVAGLFPNPVSFKLLGQFKNYKGQQPVFIDYQYTLIQCRVDKVEPSRVSKDFQLVVDGTVQEVTIPDWNQSPNCGYQIQSFITTGSTQLIQKMTDKTLQLVSNDATLSLTKEYPISITPVFDVVLPVAAISPILVKVTLTKKPMDQTYDEELDVGFIEKILTMLNQPNVQNSTTASNKTGKVKVDDNQPALMTIKKFKENGILILAFSKPVIVLSDPTVLLKRVKIPSTKRQIQSAVSVSNLQVTIAIDADNPNGYTTAYSIKNMTEDTLEVQVNFTAPLNVSSSEIPDRLSVYLWNTKRILTKANNLPVQLATTPLQIKIPRQLSGTEGETILLAVSESSGRFASQATIASAALSFFVNLGANLILSKITGLNYICNLTCINMKYPAVVMYFMATLLQFVTFDVIDTQTVYNSIFGADTSEPITENFGATGYTSGECLRNLGSIFLFHSAKLLLAAIGRLFLRGTNRYQKHWKLPKKAVKLIKKNVDATLWNGTIQFFQQNYMLLSIASLINHSKTDYIGYKWLTFNNLVSLIILVSLFAVPILLCILSYIYFEDLKKSNSARSKHWGFHLSGIRMQRDLTRELSVVKHALNYHKLTKTEAIISAFFAYPRQLAFCATLVYLRDHTWIQLLIVNFLSIFNVIFIGMYRPYEDPKLNDSKIASEVVMVIYLTLSRCYSDWVPDPVIRQMVGFTQISVVILQILQVVVQFFIDRNLTLKVKKTFYTLKHKWIVSRKQQVKKQELTKQVFLKKAVVIAPLEILVEKVKIQPKRLTYQYDVPVLQQQKWMRQFENLARKQASTELLNQKAVEVSQQDDFILPQQTEMLAPAQFYSNYDIEKMTQSFQPAKEDQQLVNQRRDIKIKEEFPLGLSRDEILYTLRKNLRLSDPEKKEIDVSDFDLTQEEMKFCSFEKVKSLCQYHYDEMARVNNSNFLDAEVHLTKIKTDSWPFGLKHMLGMHASIELDPFDYSFTKTLPQEYQDLSNDARHQYILNCLLQQFYQLNDANLNEAHEKAVASLHDWIKSDIVRFHSRLTVVMGRINEFRSQYRRGHNSRLALINNQLNTWPLQRLQSFGEKITKCRRNWYFKNEIQQSVQIQLDIFSVIQTLD